MKPDTAGTKPTQADEPRVRIFDTTLRDGEQAPGFALDRKAKLRIAQSLETLGVDVMEAGFPQASEEDFAAVREIARQVRQSTICALARCQRGDIERAAQALEGAQRGRIHLFLSTSPLHREHKLNMSRAQVLDAAVAAVTRARGLCDEVEFSAEDALRTEPQFLAEVFAAVAVAGAGTLNAPDTVGYATPSEVASLFTYLRKCIPDESVVFSAHCHDDLGLAVANTLAAVGAGARQVECTINGIGERAGNAALEEIVMALRVRAPYFGLATRIDTRRLHATSRLLGELTRQPVPRNKAIVGANAFAHESGIHQHGVLRHRGTYEIMRPQDVGADDAPLVLGRHSGRHALRQRLAALGHTPDDAALDGLFERFKALTARRSEIHDEDLAALALGLDPDAPGPWSIAHLHSASLLGSASASVRLKHEDGRTAAEAAIGEGPVDALLRAIERASACALELTGFQLRAIRSGSGAQGEARLTAEHDGRTWHGRAASTDIVEATARAVLSIVNRIAREAEARRASPPAVQGATA
ncbi:2-isopropylmalate synthase [Frateuria terrea]|uniref:2-isopropylmalate synthase n=1 Tax=Frateuria terrea TaxID=529704 RepID=A0A1H6XLZ3_9GAMM|nr:2-isopropylmalate synthase [Frateuria terrea]SEJ25850.1 2-isopropylmalate synthase [Frateuria terrea]SFP60167.1 2-isopropylmalate synthase [Frateuria terrea]